MEWNIFSWGIAYSYCTRNTYKFSWAVQLLDAVNISVNLILARDTVDKERGIAPHQKEGESLEEVTHLFLLLLTPMAGKHRTQLLDLLDRNIVPASQCIGSDRDEGDSLLPTGLSYPCNFAVKCLANSVAVGGS